ncbi:AraC family transcriptional regulator of arabinose operon [Mangrovibacter plantisponsor]|uniref:Arabinose operon regulatory protein n=2 Tax=Mangrovibacter plantisponsor TaxID=451513 RepID=A0A317PW94_9ENTR|nr:AraC family transcriptional regulator of arabinose operon [Mangrovibacter plantisponsor]
MDMPLDMNDLVNFSPLMKSFTFNAYLVSGYTPISRGGRLDYYINRPQGMKGYIINLTLRGAGRVKAGEGYITCQEGELVLFPPGIPHHYGRAESHDFWDHLWIYFMPRPYWLDWLRWDNTHQNIGRTQCETPEIQEGLKALFSEVIHHNSDDAPLSEALAMNALERLILHCFQMQPQSNRHNVDPRINALCDYLNNNIADEMTVDALAKMVFLSPSRLAHLFRSEMGETIFSWREKQRVNRARALMQSTELSVSNIAEAVGYSDAMYFSRIFRRHNGVAPREYKKRYGVLHGMVK